MLMNRLLTTYYRKPGQDICNCTMCPQLGHRKYTSREYENSGYCDVIERRVKEPEWCWCKAGIALMWMVSHKAGEVVDMLTKVAQ